MTRVVQAMASDKAAELTSTFMWAFFSMSDLDSFYRTGLLFNQACLGCLIETMMSCINIHEFVVVSMVDCVDKF